MPENKEFWTPGLAKTLAAALVVVVGGDIGFYLYFKQKPLSDDPPITVADSSLHAWSKKYRWVNPDPDPGHWITPNGASGPTGQLQPGGCAGFAKGVSAKFEYTGTGDQDISPRPGVEWKATITYLKADGSAQPVVEWIDGRDVLNIRDDDGHFLPDNDASDVGHREDKRADNNGATVTHVRVVGGKITPIDETVDQSHHFKIHVCYY